MCSNPVKIHRGDGSTQLVGCGHCLQCLKAYQDSWTARLNEECKSWLPVRQGQVTAPPVIFFTLDYCPESIPCTYLVVTDCGVRLQTERPDCPIYEFWTDTRRETRSQWLDRRRNMLRLYFEAVKLVYCTLPRPATKEDIRSLNYEYKVDGVRHGIRQRHAWFDYFDLPDFDPNFFVYEEGLLEHPSIDFDVFRDVSGVGCPNIAFEFHSVCKSDVQKWLKRGRIAAERVLPEVFGHECNPRFNPLWIDADNNTHCLPSAAVPKSVKYFITSEYGPKTYRPHYHGVMFGVTYDEFERFFAADWNSRFGRCVFSLMRPSGGALMYLAKYCSKGCYEHPYCCKDLIYPSLKEYHSKSYFNTVTDFGIDEALVTPTFHLISKGLGARYAFQAEILDYFGVQLSELKVDQRLRYTSHDAKYEGLAPSIDLSKLLVVDSNFNVGKSISVDLDDEGNIKVNKYDGNRNLVGQSFIPADAVISRAEEELCLKQFYSRTYVTQKNKINGKSVRPYCVPCWQKIGLECLCSPQTKVTRIALPRYYRQWLLSPLTSLLRQSAAIRLYPSAYEETSRAVQQGRPQDEVATLFKSRLALEAIRCEDTASRLWESTRRIYSSNGFQNLE